jgi:hypothetical protein
MNNARQQSQKDTQGAILLKAKGDCSDQVHSNQMVLGTASGAGPQMSRPKALKTKLTHGGPSCSRPLRSDSS